MAWADAGVMVSRVCASSCLKWKEDLEVHKEAGVGCQHSQTDMLTFETPFSTQERLDLPQNECFYIKCQASFQKRVSVLTEKPKRTERKTRRFGFLNIGFPEIIFF